MEEADGSAASSPTLLVFSDAVANTEAGEDTRAAIPSSELPEGKVVQAEPDPPVPDPIPDELREKIVRQVEYYFSDENLSTDKFLVKCVKKNVGGFVSLRLIASFKRLKAMVQDLSVIQYALRTSSQLVVSSDGTRVGRLHPFPFQAKDTNTSLPVVEDTKSRTVLVENLPEGCSNEYIQNIFEKVGNIKNISISDPNSTEGMGTLKNSKKTISLKLHAFVEYDTVEVAERAVASLNDEKNWSGMRVELLVKRLCRLEKFGLIPKTKKEMLSEKSNGDQLSGVDVDEQKFSSEQHNGSTKKMEMEKDRYKNKGGECLQQNSNGHGHGLVSSVPSIVISKPASGPRMPDGTRGFTMGRGKSIVAQQS